MNVQGIPYFKLALRLGTFCGAENDAREACDPGYLISLTPDNVEGRRCTSFEKSTKSIRIFGLPVTLAVAVAEAVQTSMPASASENFC